MPKRRANNEGTIYLDKRDKTYRAMVTTPAGKRITKSDKDREVVAAWLAEQKHLNYQGKATEPSQITLGQWITDWLTTYAKPKVKPRTYDRYVGLLRHIEPLYNTKLQSLKSPQLQKLFNDIDRSPQTLKHIKTCLGGCLNKAVELNMLRDNPARKIELPKIPRLELEIYTPAEIKKILKSAGNYRNPLVIKMAYLTGLRLSEVLALRCEDIKDNKLTVNQTIHASTSAGVYFSDTKTTSSWRSISIPSSLTLEISEHKIKQGIREGLLFKNSHSTPDTPHNYLKKVFKKIQTETGIAKGFHALRHTHATELLASGMPVHDVSRRLGHSKISTTLDIYTHHMPNADDKMKAALDLLAKAIK